MNAKNNSQSHEPQSASTGATQSVPERRAFTEAERSNALSDALVAKNLLIPTAMSMVMGQKTVSALGAKWYLDATMKDAGAPSDPIERIMVEQLFLAHHRIAQLHVRADSATTPEHLKVLNSACNRLLGEFRRLTLALRQYRSPVSTKQFSVISQQNIVAAGNQQVSYSDQSTATQAKVSLSERSKVEDQSTEFAFGGRIGTRLEESAAQEPCQGESRKKSQAVVA